MFHFDFKSFEDGNRQQRYGMKAKGFESNESSITTGCGVLADTKGHEVKMTGDKDRRSHPGCCYFDAQVHVKLVPSLDSVEQVDVCGLLELPAFVICEMLAAPKLPIGPLTALEIAELVFAKLV